MSFQERTDTLDIDIGEVIIPTEITRYKFTDEDLESPNSPQIEIIAYSMDKYILRVALTDYNYYLLPSLLSYVSHKMLCIDIASISTETIKSLVRLYPTIYLAFGNLMLELE